MNLVLYDEDTGRIRQVIIMAEGGLDKLSRRYIELGIPHIKYNGTANIATSYCPNGVVTDCPTIELAGLEDRPLKADGVDVFTIKTTPPNCNLRITYSDTVLHEQALDARGFEFTTDHPGPYVLTFEAPFPWIAKQVTVAAE